MACIEEFRHVCFKDLDNYIQRDQYFSDFTSDEIKLIKKNLGLAASSDAGYNPLIVTGDYDTIYKESVNSQLVVGYVYIITNFRSIYLDRDNVICGTDDNLPSQEYWLFLSPNGSSTFDKRVRMFQPDNPNATCQNWIVEYDITPTIFGEESHSRGTITYLKDQNNNYAYYDFKNIKFKKTLEELSKGPSTYTEDTYFYTFDIGGTDSSEVACKNNHLEIGSVRNIFLGNTQNIVLAADCHDNTFFKSCENCTFDYGTYGNYFQDDVKRCKGSIHEKVLSAETSQNIPKQFDIINDMEVMVYLDSTTQTYQIKQL